MWTLAGQYEHDLEKTPQGWKVTRMRMIPGESTGNASLLDRARERGSRATNREVVRAFFQRLEAFDIEGFANRADAGVKTPQERKDAWWRPVLGVTTTVSQPVAAGR